MLSSVLSYAMQVLCKSYFPGTVWLFMGHADGQIDLFRGVGDCLLGYFKTLFMLQ